MSPVHLNDPEGLATFGIEFAHNRPEVIQVPPERTALETIAELELTDDKEAIAAITSAATEVNKIVLITRGEGDETQGLLDIFTAAQIQDMSDRLHSYLGTDIDSHLLKLSKPPGYPFYIGRLATHVGASDDIITSQFGSFESRHTNPSLKATGPLERNSREYANYAVESILRQFATFYQAEFDVTLVGPSKKVEGSRISWDRGIAECQFLILDYIRDLLATGYTTAETSAESDHMTIEDLQYNITNLMENRKRLLREVTAINPMLAQQVDDGIQTVSEFTIEVLHRGRMGVPRFRKEPEAARRAIRRVEMLLKHAASLAQTRADQAEIPILDV